MYAKLDDKVVLKNRRKNSLVYEAGDIHKIETIFANWEETLIWSCLQNVMGKVLVTNKENPKSACAYVGCFMFFAGEPDKELVLNKGNGFNIMVSQNELWARLIEECYPDSKCFTRYAIKKDTKFDVAKLKANLSLLLSGYELKKIDLATVCCSALILNCLEEGLYPSWDAHNMNSVHLAQKLGYEFSHEYVAYEISVEKRTH